MDDSRGGHGYDIETYWEKLVRDYTGLSFVEIEELDYIDYLLYQRDAFIYKMQQTESGREYLENAWRLQQTEPEKDRLRERYGKEGQDEAEH